MRLCHRLTWWNESQIVWRTKPEYGCGSQNVVTYRILCVDDDPYVLAAYRMMHGLQRPSGERFHIETTENGERGLEAVAGRDPYAVIVSDMQMPGMDGIQFLRRVREITPVSVRMMLTGYTTIEVAIDAVNEGHIFRFLTKPCSPASFLQAVSAGVRQYRLLVAEKEILEQTLAGSIKVLTDVLALVNPTAFGRAVRIRQLVQRLGAALCVEDAWQLEVAAMLSQTGCMTLPEHILEKVYLGRDLPPDEAARYESHPKFGHDLIAAIPRLEEVAEIVAYQEKCFDGTGQPANDKRGTDIPFGARILKVALDFDGLESRGLLQMRAIACMRQRLGRYDLTIVDALQGIIESNTHRETKVLFVENLVEMFEALQESETCDEGEGIRKRQKPRHMILAEDMLSHTGVLLLSKGQEITRPLLQRLWELTRRKTIREPIQVWIPGSEAHAQDDARLARRKG